MNTFGALIGLLLLLCSWKAEASCEGRFLNPITDVSWKCMFPITIGNVPLMPGSNDTRNPDIPVCFCRRGDVPLVPGISIGFWEPIRVIEVTRTPYCLVSL